MLFGVETRDVSTCFTWFQVVHLGGKTQAVHRFLIVSANAELLGVLLEDRFRLRPCSHCRQCRRWCSSDSIFGTREIDRVRGGIKLLKGPPHAPCRCGRQGGSAYSTLCGIHAPRCLAPRPRSSSDFRNSKVFRGTRLHVPIGNRTQYERIVRYLTKYIIRFSLALALTPSETWRWFSWSPPLVYW